MSDPDVLLYNALSGLTYAGAAVPVFSLPCDPVPGVYVGYNMTSDRADLHASNGAHTQRTQYYVHVYGQDRAAVMAVYRSVRAALHTAHIAAGQGGPEAYDSETGCHQTQVLATITQRS